MPVTDQAFVTLATNDVYSQGALTLGQCLRRHGTSRQIVVLITPHVSNSIRAVYYLASQTSQGLTQCHSPLSPRVALARVFHQVQEVDVLDSLDCAHLAMMGRPELGVTFTKLHCWTLTQYTKCVFLDADTLVLGNVDELFEREELSAAPDPGWPDCFNSGVFVFRPSLETHNKLLRWAGERGSFDGGDQGLLNSFFSDWATQDISKHLPFIYNLSTSTLYTYLTAFQQYGHEAKIVHFLGAVKPWHCTYSPQTGHVSLEDCSPPDQHLGKFLKLWWNEHYTHVVPLMLEPDECQQSGPFHYMHQVGSGEVTSDEDLTQHTDEAFAPTAPADMRTHPEDKPPVDEEGTSEWTPDPSTSERDGAPGSKVMDSSSGEPTELSTPISELATDLKSEEEDLEHKRMWEEGNADYMGKDAFENIKKKLDRFLK